MERTGGCHIRHARNGREFRPPELPHYSVDGYCAETRTIYEFLGCYYHGCKCQPFRDVKTLASGETLAERYEQTLARIEKLLLAILSKYSGNANFKVPTIYVHIPQSDTCRSTLVTLCTGVEPRPCVFTTNSRKAWSLYSTAI